MILYLAGGETWWRYFDRYGIRNVLLSYHYLRGQTDFAEMVAWMERSKAEKQPRRFFLDSGAFTYMHGGHDTLEDLNEYADEYIRFLNTDPAVKLFDVVAELDVYQQIGDESEDDVYRRVQRHQEKIYEAVGDKILPTYQTDWLTLKDWEKVCADPRFKQVGIGSSGESGSAQFISLHKKLIAIAHRHGKVIHGFGQTRLQTDMKYLRNYDSVDSTTWLRADKYGGTFIYQNGHLRILNHEQKERRAWFKGYFKRIGLDPERILGTHKDHAPHCDGPNSQTKDCEACKDQLEELRASSLIAWRELAKKFERTGQRLVQHRSTRTLDVQQTQGVTMTPGPKLGRKKGWKGPPGTKPTYDDFGGKKCPHYRRRPREVARNLNCSACHNLPICQEVERHEYQALLDDHTATTHPEMGAPDPRQDGDGGVPFADAGTTQAAGTGTWSAGTSDGGETSTPDSSTGGGQGESNRSAREGSAVAPDTTTGSTTPEGEGGGRSLDSRESPLEDSNSPLQSQDSRESSPNPPNPPPVSPNGAPPPHSPQSSLVPTSALRRRDNRELLTTGGLNLGAWRRDIPRNHCDVCNLADECPKYQPASVCAYNEVFDQFDTRNSDDVMALQQALVEVDKDRTMAAILQERLTTGGQIDPRVTQQMNSFQNRIQVLDEMMQARNAPRPSGFNVQVQVPSPSAPDGRPGVLSMLFGSAPAQSHGEPTEKEEEGQGAVIDTTATGPE